MKWWVTFIFIASMASILDAMDFSGDVYAFLPFLKNFKTPPPCPMNEVYKICASKCSDCEQRGMCIQETCEPNCDCAPRFFRNTPEGPCEPVANCQKPVCNETEVFRECGPICEKCTTLRCHIINCDHKCYCKDGYLRDEAGKCIPMEECPKREHCHHNEEWIDVGGVDEFCLQGTNGTIKTAARNESGCYCKEGFKRNTLGHCINETLCKYVRCLGIEVYHDCIPKCNTTCRNYGDPDCREDDNCYPGCFCPSGYVMNDFRSCIPKNECSLDIEQVKFTEEEEPEEQIPDEEEEEDNPPGNQTSVSPIPDSEEIVATTEDPYSDKTIEVFLRNTEESLTPTTVSSQMLDSKPTENTCSTKSPAEDISKKILNEEDMTDDDLNNMK